jgi:two-component system, LuxR family, sensor kinase FixL
MIVIDEHGTILSFSAAAEVMFGYTQSEVAGENVSMLMPSPDRERHDGYLSRYLSTSQPKIIGIGRVTTARRRNGSTFPIELSIGEAVLPDRRVFTGFIRDLTERQKTERYLHDLQSELSHISRISAMGSLASALAHELNQPLTAIASYMEAARDLLDMPTPENIAMVREAVTGAAGQSIRAGQIVRRLRDFISRGDSEKTIESLRKLISEASALALIGAGQKGIDVRVALNGDQDYVLVDRIQIQQVLLNLIRNAIEAMEEIDTRRLEITSSMHPGNLICISIADSGPGISDDILPYLFEPFHSSKEKGMGLGLSICHTIIESHGGRIWADKSNLGGAAFHFTLMAATLEDGDDS